MAYNLQPLITILEQILDHQQTFLMIHDDNKPQLHSLLKKAISLQRILEKHSLLNIASLESQIRDAAHKAEDIIELHMVDQMLSNSRLIGRLIKWYKCFTFSSPDLQRATQELHSAMEQVNKLVEVEAGKQMISSSGTDSSSSGGADAFLNPKSATASASASGSGSIHVVGFDEDLMELKDRLTAMQSKLEIKTTLARNLYEDPLIVSHFVARAWATVSQDYNLRTILLSLVSCIIGKDKLIDRQVIVEELKDILYKSLYGRRYMIVLDDIWSTKFWDEMRMYFPDNKNGSQMWPSMQTHRAGNMRSSC